MKRTIGFAIFFLFTFVPVNGKENEKIAWLYNLDAGLAAAKKENKPLMVDFMADWCAPCKTMEDSTFSNSAVILKANDFIAVRIDIEKQREVAARYNALARAYGGVGIPNILFLSPEGTKLKHIVGLHTARQLLKVMDAVLKTPR
jgi:thiol:disulfide interchange protein